MGFTMHFSEVGQVALLDKIVHQLGAQLIEF
jgi:hypothetical protein